MGFDSTINLAVKVSNAGSGGFLGTIFAGGSDEGDDVANLAFNAGAVAIFLGGGAGVESSGALVLAEGFAEGAIAAAENPVINFALGHDVEIIVVKIATIDHRLEHIGHELENDARFVATVGFVLRNGSEDIIGAELGIFEPDLVETIFVFKNSKVIVISFDLVEIPGVEEEETVAEVVFKAVGSEAWGRIVGDWVELVVRDFAGEDAVFFELAHDDAGVTDDLGGALFDGFLAFRVAVHVINDVFEGGGGDVMEETG